MKFTLENIGKGTTFKLKFLINCSHHNVVFEVYKISFLFNFLTNDIYFIEKENVKCYFLELLTVK